MERAGQREWLRKEIARERDHLSTGPDARDRDLARARIDAYVRAGVHLGLGSWDDWLGYANGSGSAD
jgi:hypothetical protein